MHCDSKNSGDIVGCCRLCVVLTSCTVVPVAPRVMWQQELVTAMHIPCHGMNCLWWMWISRLPMMFSVPMVSRAVLMRAPAVSCSQATMAAVHILRWLLQLTEIRQTSLFTAIIMCVKSIYISQIITRLTVLFVYFLKMFLRISCFTFSWLLTFVWCVYKYL